jgi:hypothetical protein
MAFGRRYQLAQNHRSWEMKIKKPATCHPLREAVRVGLEEEESVAFLLKCSHENDQKAALTLATLQKAGSLLRPLENSKD